MITSADMVRELDMACTSQCSQGDTTCASDGTVVSCIVTSGCGAFPSGGGIVCGANQACIARGNAAACTCNSDVKCASGAGSYCTTDAANGNVDATYSCAADSDGCIVAGNALSDCGTHQTCTGAAGSANCTCNSDANCPIGAGTFCNGSSSYITCSTDQQLCVYDAGTSSCSGSQVCSASGVGDAGCTCPAAGTSAGSGCTTPGDQTCGGGDVLTCQTSGGCNLWVDTLACSSVSLSCTTSGNAASCTCPISNGVYRVQPGVTPITFGGATVAPTGADSPAGCRFATVGAGLTAGAAWVAATKGPADVPLVGPVVTVTAESWPLIVPPKVYLFTDVASPTRFTLSPPAGVQAVVVQGGAALGNMTIAANLTGANSPAAISVANCTATNPVVFMSEVDISFSGATTGDGVNVADPGAGEQGCDATMDTFSITNAYNGISVSTPGGLASSTIGAEITASTITGSLHDGVLVYQTGSNGVFIGGTTTISGSHSKNVEFNTSTLAAHTGLVRVGSATIANSYGGAYGIVVTNNASGQLASGAVLNLIDVTVVGNINSGSYSNDALSLTNATATLAGYVSQDSGASRGLYAVDSIVSMRDDANGKHCSMTGAVGGNPGMRIDSGTTLTATNAVFSGNSASGAIITNGHSGAGPTSTTLTLNNCTFSGNLGGHGIDANGADANNTVMVSIAGGSYDSNPLAGIHVGNYATVDLTGAFSASNNGGDGMIVDGTNAALTIGSPGASSPKIDSNVGDGIAQSNGTVNASGTNSPSPMFVDIVGNGGNGINFTGGSFSGNWLNIATSGGSGARVINPAGGIFALLNSNVTDHAASAIVVNNSNNGGKAVQIEQSTISNPNVTPRSGTYGIEIDQSAIPSSSAVYSTYLSGINIVGCNAGLGVGAGTTNPVALHIDGSGLESNRGAGMLYNSVTSSSVNALEAVSNRVVENGATVIGSGSVGGLGFQGTPPASMVIDQNVVGNNAANQVYVLYTGSGAASYNFASGSNEWAECTAAGYALFGECTTSGATLSIDADNASWTDTSFPDQNYASSGAGTVNFLTSNPSGPVSCPTP